MAVNRFHLAVVLVDCAFEKAVEPAAVLRHGKTFEATRALQVEDRHLSGRVCLDGKNRIIGGHDRLAVDCGRDDVGQAAFRIELKEVGSEFFADPETVCDRLHGLDVEIRTGEIALLGAFKHDREGCLLFGVGKEKVLDDLNLAGLPIERHLMQEEHRVA